VTPEFFELILVSCCFVYGGRGAIATNSRLVIPFSRADRRRKIARVEIPDH